MHTLATLAMTELNILTSMRKIVTGRTIYAYLALAVTGLNIQY